MRRDGGPQHCACTLRAPSLPPAHDGACGESQLELGRWGQVEGGREAAAWGPMGCGASPALLPSPQHTPSSGPQALPPTQSPHILIHPGPHSPPCGPKFFQAAPPSPSRPSQTSHLKLFQVLWPSGLKGWEPGRRQRFPGSGFSCHWMSLLSCPTTPSKPPFITSLFTVAILPCSVLGRFEKGPFWPFLTVTTRCQTLSSWEESPSSFPPHQPGFGEQGKFERGLEDTSEWRLRDPEG